jgi:radical SAM superfamily enzyme YgiQ (UPF0313 family)
MKIGLVQINNSFSKQYYFPYSVGLLQAYLIKYAKTAPSISFLRPIFTRIMIHEAVEQLMEADVVLCSIYVWNVRLTLEIIKQLKLRKPSVKIIFGGPQVPDRAEKFLKENPFIDIAVHGEGELIVTNLIDNLHTEVWKQTPSISYIENGEFKNNVKGKRLKDINVVPSPYLMGLFDEIIELNKDIDWIAIWESNRGCPFSCTFCDWGSSTQNRIVTFNLDRLNEEINWFSSKKIDFVFCCDSNFGLLPRDLEIAKYIASVKKATNYPKYLSVQNTKNATERSYEVQKILSDAGFNKGVTIAMQSMDPQTLKNIKRDNISIESFKELQRRFLRDGVETYSDLILALPGETYDSFSNSIGEIISNGQHHRIQFNNLSILPNAEMGNSEYQAKYGMVTVESDITNIHGYLPEIENDIKEKQQLVIATSSMSKEDWVKTRAFCWMTALLHFDKLIQVPILVVNNLTNMGYKQIIELFIEGDLSKYPTLAWVRDYFCAKAKDIQNGGNEYCHSKEFLDIYWTADELCFILLLAKGNLNAFYEEAFDFLSKFFTKDLDILKEAFTYNKAIIKQPFQNKNQVLILNCDMPYIYHELLKGQTPAYIAGEYKVVIDKTSKSWNSWEDYCREVIWYGNKKGAYLYTDTTQGTETA